jgi:outer membrane protein OmpA-like peptidoglycan-associated protein
MKTRSFTYFGHDSLLRKVRPWFAALRVLSLVMCLSACSERRADAPVQKPPEVAPAAASGPETSPVAPSAAPLAASAVTASLPIQTFDDAVLGAANKLLANAAALAPARSERMPLVIDPLIDGVTGAQTQASRSMGERLAALIQQQHPQFEVLPFNATSVARSPLILLGTLTGVNQERKPEGRREAYRIWFTLADLKSGKIVSKAMAFSTTDGVDTTPTAYFRDNPVWAQDAATQGYLGTCQGSKPGDAISPLYLEKLAAAAWLAEAISAYDSARYKQALTYYQGAAQLPAGQQLRTHVGLYLTHLKLGQSQAAMQAFGQMVDHGLEQKKLSLKFLFRPGSTAFMADTQAKLYPLWLAEVSARSKARQACLQVTGHTSASGPEPVNERLSLLRAEFIKGEIKRREPSLAPRLIAAGAGSRETLIGNGQDNQTDALDRRVEFVVLSC